MTSDRCPLCDEVAERLRGRAWTALSAREVDAMPDAIAILSARALRSYAPAIMIRALENPGSPAAAALLARLSSRDDAALTSDAHRRTVAATRVELLPLLRQDQLDVLRAFAGWACSYRSLRETARAAIDGLTGQP
jgi:hypothetical protein